MRHRAKIGKNLACVHSKLIRAGTRAYVQMAGQVEAGSIAAPRGEGCAYIRVGPCTDAGWPQPPMPRLPRWRQACRCSTQVACRVKAESVAPPLGEGRDVPGLAPMPTLSSRGGQRKPTMRGWPRERSKWLEGGWIAYLKILQTLLSKCVSKTNG